MKLSTVTLMLSCLLLSAVIASGDKGSSRSNSRSGSNGRSARQIPARPRDCWDWKRLYPSYEDGVYEVYPGDVEGAKTEVLCDMTTDEGGWTIFQQRYNGAVDFNRSYAEFKTGFGDLNSEFWMGNDLLHTFTAYENQTLRIDFCEAGNAKYVIYETFAVASGPDCYRLHISGYQGTASDAMIGPVAHIANDDQCFSTYDKDQDRTPSYDCAQIYKSGWWFNKCTLPELNAPFDEAQKLTWSYYENFHGVQMKFRPSHINNTDADESTFQC